MKQIILSLFCLLTGCSLSPQMDLPKARAPFVGKYSLRCTNYLRTPSNHEPLGPYKEGFENTVILVGTTQKIRNLQTYKDTLSLTLAGERFTFEPGSNLQKEASGGGYFAKDTLAYERVYIYRDKTILYEEVCNCVGRKSE